MSIGEKCKHISKPLEIGFDAGLGKDYDRAVVYQKNLNWELTPNTLNMLFRHQVWLLSLLTMRPNSVFSSDLVNFHVATLETLSNFMHEYGFISPNLNNDIYNYLYCIYMKP